jgi:hypothetical protein
MGWEIDRKTHKYKDHETERERDGWKEGERERGREGERERERERERNEESDIHSFTLFLKLDHFSAIGKWSWLHKGK